MQFAGIRTTSSIGLFYWILDDVQYRTETRQISDTISDIISLQTVPVFRFLSRGKEVEGVGVGGSLQA